MVVITAAFEDAVNIVLNHAPWFWPHQDASSQEMVNMNSSAHTPKTELCGGGVGRWYPGLVAPERMHCSGCKGTPDVCPGEAAHESVSSGADAGPEWSRNERSRADMEEKMAKEHRLLGVAAL